MDQSQIENCLLECRRLITHSVTDNKSFSSLPIIRENFPAFIRECHTAYKTVAKKLIDAILELENEIISFKKNKDTLDKKKINQIQDSMWLCELFFNTFVWIAMGWDRSSVRKLFKGPKYGSIIYQNVDSLWTFIEDTNKNSDNFVIALDFCSFSCICDLLMIEFIEKEKSIRLRLIEAKSGNANKKMLETINSRDNKMYFTFFQRYGEKGIKQMERCFRQHNILSENTKLIHAVPGIYNNPGKKDEKLIIVGNPTPRETYLDTVIKLLEAADKNEYAVDEVDDCLVVGVTNNQNKDSIRLGEFDTRLFIYQLYIKPSLLKEPVPPSSIVETLKDIKLINWRDGFVSIILDPIAVRPIPDKYLMDLLWGRKTLNIFFNPERFIEICSLNGVQAEFTTLKDVNKMKSKGEANGLVDFDGKFIKYKLSNLEYTLGDGTFHEMYFNWVTPKSIIEGLKSAIIPDLQSLKTSS